ncbi:T9SS type A sorting domain-containing protein [Epilithonimonas lactis]|uniref:Secretion system C-terminal sorting domain-containing protein n=1 Tax=Epilithonimonas lactis TaxID=421072 RepID=A0A085BHB2_9FLAO|nr:T9SS type A sorting domain-containing protein [Epilithonimonas lactis]KFC21857.1 hypothetical protein IO89_07665 [Epilithonimonas lactis]SEQ46676.1 Por secretion system C-terminal sorting domain-containing protein [Epilithonimonas lactis]
MKRILFSLIATSAIFYSANAQTTKYSFETSEGFTLGDIVGQNDNVDTYWSSEVSITETAEVTSEFASDGSNSVKIINYDDTEMGGIFITNVPSYGKTSVSYDVYVPELNLSDNYFILYDSEGIAAAIDFTYQGTIDVYKPSLEDFSTVGTFTANQWYKVKLDIDYGTKQYKVFVDGSQVYSGAFEGTGTGIAELDFAIDNYGSDAYFDNIQIADATLATSEVTKKDIFRVYPNPTVDVVNFDVAGKINSVEFYDAAGKLVKAAKDGARSLDVSALSKGNYVVKVQTETGSHTQKLIKK